MSRIHQGFPEMVTVISFSNPEGFGTEIFLCFKTECEEEWLRSSNIFVIGMSIALLFMNGNQKILLLFPYGQPFYCFSQSNITLE